MKGILISQGPVYQQYDPRIENQEMVFGPPAEFKDLQICTVDFGTHYVIEYFNNDSVTLVKLESLPFPVCDNELTITHNVPFLDIPRNILNEKAKILLDCGIVCRPDCKKSFWKHALHLNYRGTKFDQNGL